MSIMSSRLSEQLRKRKRTMKITKEQFFKEFELDMQMLPYGVEELGVSIALPKNAEELCWDFMNHNKLKIDEIIKVSDEFEFVSESNFKFILKRKELLNYLGEKQ